MVSSKYKTIKEVLSQDTSRHFWVSCKDGIMESGDKESFYSKDLKNENLLFDISNNKVLANCSSNGSVKNLTVYRSSYPEDLIPGVWVAKDFYKTGPYSFSIKIDGEMHDLNKTDWPYKTSLLDNIFPITKFTGEKTNITLLSYAPISENGYQRPRCLIYGIMVENTSGNKITGTVVCPSVRYTHDCDTPPNTSSFIRVGDNIGGFPEVPFGLEPGDYVWVPVIISAPGEYGIEDEINSHGSLGWLNSTWSYFKALTGKLTMPEDRFMEEFFERAVHQCLESISMDGNGDISGANWGTYPSYQYIWMKDMYYSFLPLHILDTSFLKKGISWFLKYSICTPRNRFEGGINHSLSNSLTPVILAGLYYESTGDKSFFLENDEIREKLTGILNKVLDSRDQTEIWLFRSIFLSDGYSWGNYHTGTNVCCWYSFKSFARILDEVYQDKAGAEQYGSIASRIKKAIDSCCISNGPYGRQYVEGVDSTGSIPSVTRRQDIFKWEDKFGTNPDGTIPVMLHDGEESDTTLMPVYGFLSYDNPEYKNLTRFALSENNPLFVKETKGINWYNTDGTIVSDATFPGYITGLADITDFSSMYGENGYMTEVRRLTDVDGSIWWWPYPEHGVYGQARRTPMKCGWASGVFACLFISEFLGIKYDGAAKVMNFRPFSPSSCFSWEDFRIGDSIFSVSYTKGKNQVDVTVTNKNNHNILLNLEVPLDDSFTVKSIMAKGNEKISTYDEGAFLGRHTVKLSYILETDEVTHFIILSHE